jgi:hypothetical protein
MLSRTEELEKENEELRNKLDIAVQRREYIEQKIFASQSQYIMCTIEMNAVEEIRKDMDRQFIDDIKAYAHTKPNRVRGL